MSDSKKILSVTSKIDRLLNETNLFIVEKVKANSKTPEIDDLSNLNSKNGLDIIPNIRKSKTPIVFETNKIKNGGNINNSHL